MCESIAGVEYIIHWAAERMDGRIEGWMEGLEVSHYPIVKLCVLTLFKNSAEIYIRLKVMQ